MTLNGMLLDPHNGVNSLDLILVRLHAVANIYRLVPVTVMSLRH